MRKGKNEKRTRRGREEEEKGRRRGGEGKRK